VSIGKLGKLVITGPATVVMGAFTTVGAATLELDCTKGPITIYDTGKWAVDKNFTLAPALGSPVDAAVMVTKGTVRFQQGSTIYAGFYCPEATIQVDAARRSGERSSPTWSPSPTARVSTSTRT
jgi:hypothetical protein